MIRINVSMKDSIWRGLYPDAQMYSQLSMFERSSTSSRDTVALLGATVNSGQNIRSHTALIINWPSGSCSSI